METMHQNISAWWSSDGPLSAVAVIAAIVCALWISGLLTALSFYLVARRRRRARFAAAAVANGFDKDDVAALWFLGKFSNSSDRAAILSSEEAFENCVRLANIQSAEDTFVWPESVTDAVIAALRRKFEKDRHPRMQLTSTRQIEQNQPVSVSAGSDCAFDTFVTEVKNDAVILSLPLGLANLESLRSARVVRVSFWRPSDASYEFTSMLMEPPTTLASYVRLAHTGLERSQRRRSARARSRDSISLETVASPAKEKEAPQPARSSPDLRHVGTLMDISRGGACFITDVNVNPDSFVAMRIGLPRDPWAIQVTGRVVRRRTLVGTSNPMVQASVEFQRLTNQQEYHLGRLVADLQVNVMRRMVARATSRTHAAAEAQATIGRDADASSQDNSTETQAVPEAADRPGAASWSAAQRT